MEDKKKEKQQLVSGRAILSRMEDIPRKDEILCKFAEFWFNELDVPNHFVKRESHTEIIVKKMRMLSIECVVRGHFYGSYVSRWKKGKVAIPATPRRMHDGPVPACAVL